jgi:hypothetical protein
MTLARKVTCSKEGPVGIASNNAKEIYDDLEIPSSDSSLDELSPTDHLLKANYLIICVVNQNMNFKLLSFSL